MGPQRGRSKLPLLSVVGVVFVLAAAGAFVFLNQSSEWQPGAEPTPPHAWTTFTNPDATWSVRFPGSGSPRTMTQSMDTGFGSMSMTMYLSMDAGVAYEAASVDMPSAALAGVKAGDLKDFESGLLSSTGGRITGSRGLTFKTYSAREVRFTEATGMKLDGYARFWIAGNRMYVLIVMANPGTTMYPEHFFDSFNLI